MWYPQLMQSSSMRGSSGPNICGPPAIRPLTLKSGPVARCIVMRFTSAIRGPSVARREALSIKRGPALPTPSVALFKRLSSVSQECCDQRFLAPHKRIKRQDDAGCRRHDLDRPFEVSTHGKPSFLAPMPCAVFIIAKTPLLGALLPGRVPVTRAARSTTRFTSENEACFPRDSRFSTLAFTVGPPFPGPLRRNSRACWFLDRIFSTPSANLDVATWSAAKGDAEAPTIRRLRYGTGVQSQRSSGPLAPSWLGLAA